LVILQALLRQIFPLRRDGTLLSNDAKRNESDDRRPAVRPRIPAHLIFPSQHFYEDEGSFIKRPMLFTLIAA
jgi:hypothetical protein